MKKLITILICSLLIPVAAQAAVVSGAIATILFAGKVYSLAAPTVSGLTAMAKTVAIQSTILGAEQTITSYLQSINAQIEKKESESTFAETEEGARQALNEALTLRESYTVYSGLLYSLRNNKAVVIKETLLNEASSRTTGYIKGQAYSYLINDDVVELVNGLALDTDSTARNLINGEGSSRDVQESDAVFYSALKEGRATPIKVAITKAEWDKFVNITAKEEFKQYLRGENDFFEKLPMSVQEKYWSKLFLLTPTDMANINSIMANAKITGNYADALKAITEKYPYYKQTFTDLTKDLVGDSKKLAEKITQGVREKAQNQTTTLNQSKTEQESFEQADNGFPSEEELFKFVNDYADSINAKNLEGVMDAYHKDWLQPNNYHDQGYDELRDALKDVLGVEAYSDGSMNIWTVSNPRDLKIRTFRESLYLNWTWNVTAYNGFNDYQSSDNEPKENCYELKRSEDGKWRIIDSINCGLLL